MKQRNKNSNDKLIRRILQREGDEQAAYEMPICSRCFSRISHGRYYEIGGETFCSECIYACERRK